MATKSYGSASVESMKVSTRNLLRKITKATEAGAGGFEDAGKPDTPVKTPKKRKADASPDNDGSAKAKKSRAKKVKAEPIEGPRTSALKHGSRLTFRRDYHCQAQPQRC